IGAEAGSGLLQLRIQFLEYRLDRAHDERQPDEGKGNDDAKGTECRLDAESRQPAAYPAVFSVEGRQGDTADGRGKGEGKVDESINQPLAEKPVPDQHP